MSPSLSITFFFLSSKKEHSHSPRHVHLTFKKTKFCLTHVKGFSLYFVGNKLNLHSKKTAKFLIREVLADFTKTFFIFKMAHGVYDKHANLILLTIVLLWPAEGSGQRRRVQNTATIFSGKTFGISSCLNVF